MDSAVINRRTLVGDVSLPVRAAIVLAGTVLLAISARIQVPFYPVPMAMQTFVVLFLGFASAPGSETRRC